ncbi:hypothetical protein BGZ63DRAFT_32914 [Mariannaea sp. PMI_226]|nr:hypothetical protein BGZ63DRAFT_32914 [Mariannaea sp. PMI_226]
MINASAIICKKKVQKCKINSGTGNRTLGSAELIPQIMRARNVSHYTIPDVCLMKRDNRQSLRYHTTGGYATLDCPAYSNSISLSF